MSGKDHVPDARDGLTNVERRLLHWLSQPDGALQACRTVIDRARRQSELTRGEVYGVLVGMIRDERSRYPLVEGEGDFGDTDGRPPASSLETEGRLSPAGNAMFGPGDRRIRQSARHAHVDPAVVLGGVFPTILANGSVDGLASIPPHNLSELVAAITARIDDPELSLDRVLELMPGPDFIGGATLVDLGEVRDAYATGSGSIRLRVDSPADPRDSETEADVLLVALIDGKPEKCSLLELIDHYVDHQRAVRGAADSSDVDGDLKRDLAALAADYPGARRTALPAGA